MNQLVGERKKLIICLVVPTYNERENIRPVVERVEAASALLPGDELHLLFVDDSSPDGTSEEVRSLAEAHQNVHLFVRSSKKGLGTAYRDGFEHVFSTIRAEVLVQMDADLQHPPEKVPELVEAIREGADVALGSRYVRGGGVEGWNWRRRLISKGANSLARFLLRLQTRDTTTGFKAMDRAATKAILSARLSSSGFAYQVESLVVFRKNHLKVVEIPYVFKERLKGKSKLSTGEILSFLRSVLRLAIGAGGSS